MKLALCGLFLFAQIAHAGLKKYSSLVVADKYPFTESEPNAIRVTYLGVNGFQFETSGHALLVDPYFTRVALFSAALNHRIESNPRRANEGLRHVQRRVDAVLVTHAHFDHLLDVPEIMRRTHARQRAGPAAIQLVVACGMPPNDGQIFKPPVTRKIGPW